MKCHSLEAHINMIAEGLLRNRNEVKEVGLLNGKAGIALLFAYLSKRDPEKYLTVLHEYLDEMANSLSYDNLHYSLSIGVAGIAFTFQHLRNIDVLDRSEDINLSQLDEFLGRAAETDFHLANWDPLHGLVGLGVYFLERIRETGEKKYLEKIVDYLSQLKTDTNGHSVWITSGFGEYEDCYNLGMAHGMPGVLSFLAQAYVHGVRRSAIREMISSCISFLLTHKRAAGQLYSFPSSIGIASIQHTERQQTRPRHGWCYGDLGMANALIHCGKSLNREDWLHAGIDIALKTTRIPFEDARCDDAPFCHGSSGLIHQYHRIYRLTKHSAFKNAAESWLNLTLKHFYEPDKFVAGYFFRKYNDENKDYTLVPSYGLLDGISGIALVYLSYEYSTDCGWDIIFQTNV